MLGTPQKIATGGGTRFEASMREDLLRELIHAAKQALREAQKKLRKVKTIIASIEETRAYTLESFGRGMPNGGTNDHRKNRFRVMDRVRSVACLTPPQATRWQSFKELWDAMRAEVSGPEWGEVFAQEMVNIQVDLLEGHTEASSKFMEDERQRILSHEPVLLMPQITV